MRRTSSTIMAFGLAGASLVLSGQAWAAGPAGACYDGGGGFRFFYTAVGGRTLPSDQDVYLVVGKAGGISGSGMKYMAPLSGSVVTNTNSAAGPIGAQLGFRAYFVRTDGGGPPSPGSPLTSPIDMNCVSSTASPTPSTWSCATLLNETGQKNGTTPVPIVANPNNDPACVAFQGAAVSAARQAKSAR